MQSAFRARRNPWCTCSRCSASRQAMLVIQAPCAKRSGQILPGLGAIQGSCKRRRYHRCGHGEPTGASHSCGAARATRLAARALGHRRPAHTGAQPNLNPSPNPSPKANPNSHPTHTPYLYLYPYHYPYPLLTLTRRGPSCGALHGRAGAVLHDVRSTHRPTAPPSAPHPAPPHTAPTPTRKGQGSSPRPRVVRRVPHSYCCPTTHTNFIWVCFRFPNRTLPNQAPLPRRRR